MVAFLNRAGSVGKTTIAYNTAVVVGQYGYRVLVIDADLQSDLSYWATYDGDVVPPGDKTIHDVMLGKAPLSAAIVQARTRVGAGDDDDAFEALPGVFVARGHRDMEQADSELAQDAMAVMWLQETLEREITKDDYDLVFVDCPASQGRLTTSVLVAASEVLCAIKPTFKEFRGAVRLTEFVEGVAGRYSRYHATPKVFGYMTNEATKTESQGKFYQRMQELSRETWGADLMLPHIPRVVTVPEAYEAQEPLPIWDPKSAALPPIRELAEILGFPDKSAA
ncbi:ParA family protein [Actinocorallia aurea]